MNDQDENIQGNGILKSKFEHAKRKLKNGKAMWVALDVFCIDMICKLAIIIKDSAIIPTQMKQSLCIAQSKKGNLLNCNSY